MGWGDAPHEGYQARLQRDGRMVGEWSAETDRESTGYLAVLLLLRPARLRPVPRLRAERRRQALVA
jgi:hypothetical protein